MKKNFVVKYLFYFALTFILCTCNDPVFYTISQEVKPIEPRIKGSPTNFAVYNGYMYVASGNILHKYIKDKPNKAYWSVETMPGGNILQIASTGNDNYLYALCSTDKNSDGKTVIKRYDGSSWQETGGSVVNSNKVQDIFAVNDVLFIWASNYKNSTFSYTIHYIEGSSNITKELTIPNITNTGELKGAAYNGTSYFLCINKGNVFEGGVLKIDNISTGTASFIDASINLAGIINLQDDGQTILLIARNGSIYTVNDSIEKQNVSLGRLATGALAIWKENEDPASNRLFLAGRQDSLTYTTSSGYTYGYMELEFAQTTGIDNDKSFIEPGKTYPTTVESNDRYLSTLGKYPLRYIFQVPPDIDEDMILFASTQKNGVWSYRVRNGKSQWNAEE